MELRALSMPGKCSTTVMSTVLTLALWPPHSVALNQGMKNSHPGQTSPTSLAISPIYFPPQALPPSALEKSREALNSLSSPRKQLLRSKCYSLKLYGELSALLGTAPPLIRICTQTALVSP